MEADLIGLGQHCAVEDCQQLDFLPFKCDCCQKTYCLEHRTYTAHACAKAGSKQLEVIVCPMCASGIRLQPGEDANLAFERHTASGCDPSNYQRVHRKPRCPAAGCKEKLTSINTYSCKGCGRSVCMRHRMAEDHQCAQHRAPAPSPATSGAAAAAALGAAASRLWGSLSRPNSNSSSASTAASGAAAAAAQRRAQAAAQYTQPDNSVKGTAARRRPPEATAPAQQATRPPPPPAAATAAAAAPGGGLLPEVCPQCGTSFATIQELILHVDAAHTSQQLPPSRAAAAAAPGSRPGSRGPTIRASGGGGDGEQFACHRCGARFQEALLLLEHDGRCGAAGSSTACVLS